MYKLFEKKYTAALISLSVLVVIVLSFSVSGVFNEHIDAHEYSAEIVSMQSVWNGGTPSVITFKPFYGVVGSLLSLVFSPYVSILIINIFFLSGLAWIVYILLRELDFDETLSMVGTIWVILGYPVLKYGLALSTDIAGWYFAALTIAVFLFAVRTDAPKHVLFASLIGFAGSTAKETGVLGLIFCGLYILFQIGTWSGKKIGTWLAALCVPFFALQAILIYCVTSVNGGTLVNWFASNQQSYGESYRTLKYFVGVEGSAFNIIAILALVGLVYAFARKDMIKKSWLSIYLPLAIASIPVLVWPIFISRILFAQFIFVVPLALYGLLQFKKGNGSRTMLGVPAYAFIAALPVIASVILFIVSGNGSLFAHI